MISKSKTKEKGFTLIEALFAVSVFTISVVSLLSVIGTGIADTNHAKRKVTSVYLAQEGIEFIRNMRDTYILYNAGTGWSSFSARVTGSSSPCDETNGCFYNDLNLDYADQTQPITDSTTVPITACSNSSCANGALSYDSSNGKYGYGTGGTWTSSGFTRKINTTVISVDEIKITSTVSWTRGTQTYSATLSENLFNWTD